MSKLNICDDCDLLQECQDKITECGAFKELEAKDKIIAEQEEKIKELKDNLIVCRTYSNSLNRLLEEREEFKASVEKICYEYDDCDDIHEKIIELIGG